MSKPSQIDREFPQRSELAMPDWTRSLPTPPTIDLTGPSEPPRARAPLTLPTRSVEIIEIDSNDEDSDIGGSRRSGNNNYISSGDNSDSDGDDVLIIGENPAQAGPSNLHEYFGWRRVPMTPSAPRPPRVRSYEFGAFVRDRRNINDPNVGNPLANRSQVRDEGTTRARSARREVDSSHSLDAQIAAAIASGGRVQHHHHHHHHVVRPHPYNNPALGAPQQQQRHQPHNQQRQRRGPLQVVDEAILGLLGLAGAEQLSAFDQFARAREERRIRQRSESMFRDDPTDEIDFYRLHQEMEERGQAVAAEARAAAAAASGTLDPTADDELEPGFTKSLTLDTVVICPTCRLPFGHSGVEAAELWVIWGCGHVICGDCVDTLFITKTEIKPNQEKISKSSPSKHGRGKGRAKNKASSKMVSEDDGGADVDMSERDLVTKEDPEAEKLYKLTKKQYGNCPCCNRKMKRSSIVRLYH